MGLWVAITKRDQPSDTLAFVAVSLDGDDIAVVRVEQGDRNREKKTHTHTHQKHGCDQQRDVLDERSLRSSSPIGMPLAQPTGLTSMFVALVVCALWVDWFVNEGLID